MADDNQQEFLRFVAVKIVESIRANFEVKFKRGLPENGIRFEPTADGQEFQVLVDETIFMHNKGGHENPHKYTDEQVAYVEGELDNFGIKNIQPMSDEKYKLSPEGKVSARAAIYSAVRETPIEIGQQVRAKADELGIELQLAKRQPRKPLEPDRVGKLGGMAIGVVAS